MRGMCMMSFVSEGSKYRTGSSVFPRLRALYLRLLASLRNTILRLGERCPLGTVHCAKGRRASAMWIEDVYFFMRAKKVDDLGRREMLGS